MIGGDMIVYVPASDMQKVLDWNMVEFSGVNLKITADMVEDIFNLSMKDATPRNSNLSETIKILDEVLRIRYNPEIKLLDLSHLGNDVLLKQNGFFELGSTTSKMFPALMSIADKKFTNNEQKRDWLHSVSLAGNNLKNIAPVTALSIVFPDLKNLSLDGNLIEDMKGLDGWRSRFRNLEQLILLGNPVVYAPGYKEEMLRRYPKLVMLDNVVIDRLQIQIGNQNAPSRSQSAQRPVTATGLKGEPILPLTIKDNLLVDTNGLAMSFLTR
jgi:nuclear RNA export factor